MFEIATRVVAFVDNVGLLQIGKELNFIHCVA